LLEQADRAAAAAAAARPAPKKLNSRAKDKGRMPPRWAAEVSALYVPFLDRLYVLIAERQIAVSPCEERGTRFLDPPPVSVVAEGARRGGRGGGGAGRAAGAGLFAAALGGVGRPRRAARVAGARAHAANTGGGHGRHGLAGRAFGG
jgi:hypothetical protein